ncbi:F0F1 ATP synthase subunit B [Mycoplasmopsis cricetuli]|uniref:F0F1 ATP synthase subunit B n=1 Tax=Mycoplasmopsis cricetuli TaxID=171283 RepID=UPI0004B970AD|nr:F0F1 ATP synthase subunit B [Mycoplasmopsis cricetuli]
MPQEIIKLFNQNISTVAIDANNKDLPTSITEKFEAIFPSIPLMIATVIAFIIIFVFTYVFLKKPIAQIIKKRQQFIQDNIDSSVKLKEELIEKINESNTILENSNKQGEKIVNQAKLRAEQVVINFMAKAKHDSKQLIEEAHLDIEKQKKEFEENSRKIVALTAKELAEKILKKEVSQQTQEEIIEAFLNNDDHKDLNNA